MLLTSVTKKQNSVQFMRIRTHFFFFLRNMIFGFHQILHRVTVLAKHSYSVLQNKLLLSETSIDDLKVFGSFLPHTRKNILLHKPPGSQALEAQKAGYCDRYTDCTFIILRNVAVQNGYKLCIFNILHRIFCACTKQKNGSGYIFPKVRISFCRRCILSKQVSKNQGCLSFNLVNIPSIVGRLRCNNLTSRKIKSQTSPSD